MSEIKRENSLTRREFLKFGAVTGGAAILAACAPNSPNPDETLTSPTVAPTSEPSVQVGIVGTGKRTTPTEEFTVTEGSVEANITQTEAEDTDKTKGTQTTAETQEEEDYQFIYPEGIGEKMTQAEMREIVNNSRRFTGESGTSAVIPLKIQDASFNAPDNPDNQILEIYTVIAREPKLSPEGLHIMDVIVPVDGSEYGELALVTAVLHTDDPNLEVAVRRAQNYDARYGGNTARYESFPDLLKEYLNNGDSIYMSVSMDYHERTKNYTRESSSFEPWIETYFDLIDKLGANSRALSSISRGELEYKSGEVLGPIGPVIHFMIGVDSEN